MKNSYVQVKLKAVILERKTPGYHGHGPGIPGFFKLEQAVQAVYKQLVLFNALLNDTDVEADEPVLPFQEQDLQRLYAQ